MKQPMPRLSFKGPTYQTTSKDCPRLATELSQREFQVQKHCCVEVPCEDREAEPPTRVLRGRFTETARPSRKGWSPHPMKQPKPRTIRPGCRLSMSTLQVMLVLIFCGTLYRSFCRWSSSRNSLLLLAFVGNAFGFAGSLFRGSCPCWLILLFVWSWLLVPSTLS